MDTQPPIHLRAVSFAARAHAGQVRKDKTTPYIAHPMRVMAILSTVFRVTGPEVLAAGVLHDTIEDTTIDRDDLIEQFGERVAGYVAALTKDPRLPEEERESAYLETLANSPIEVRLCKLADTCDNLLDSHDMPETQRRKILHKAERLIERLQSDFPAAWKHALQYTTEQIAALRAML